FHGWHDGVAAGSTSHFTGGVPAGIPPQLVAETVLLPADDPARVTETLKSREDIAAVLLEPSGASAGQVPLPQGFLAALRETTRDQDVLLIFDEVITGFRWSRGGAQARFGVTPDLTVLAKIVAGGLPGAAVAGRADVLDQLDAGAALAAGREKVPHQGTFNANPVTAAAAVTALSIIEKQDICGRAESAAEDIRKGMRMALVEEGVPWGVYGEASAFHVFLNPRRLPIDPMTFDPLKLGFDGLKGARSPEKTNRLRIAMIANGVDLNGSGGLVSAVHGEKEVARTLEGFRTAVKWLKAEGDV
ncbi:MAG: aminotransferase class III-fold pyridoxal phosphate-dependent enzyme, partial [Hyphomicrobiaceae bacterium]